MKCLVDFKLQNNDEKIEKKDIKAIYTTDKVLSFSSDSEKIKINIKKNSIIMQKENSDSLVVFDFKLNKKTETKYYIKELDFYIDTQVLTKRLIIKDNYIHIEYELWLSEEHTGKYTYQIDIKEM